MEINEIPIIIFAFILGHIIEIITISAILFIGYIVMAELIIPVVILFAIMYTITKHMMKRAGYNKPFHRL